MSRHQGVFVPEQECMVPSGECFTIGRCLAKCKKRAFYEHQYELRKLQEHVAELHRRIIHLERKK